MISRTGSRFAVNAGFTLVEVLVALSIVVVSFVALYSGLLQMVGAMTLMQEKTIASWIAYDRITELRILDNYPDIGESDGKIEMGRINWLYKTEIRGTNSDDIRQVIVRVAPENDPQNFLGIASGALVRKAAGSTAGQIPGAIRTATRTEPVNPEDNSGGIEE